MVINDITFLKDALVFYTLFRISYYFWMITWIKKAKRG